MPLSAPRAANEFGPSTTAPRRNGGPFGGTGTILVTWCCMQSGKVLPSPTISDVPHAFAPSTFACQRFPYAAYAVELVRLSYSFAMITRPPPCEVVSYVAQGNPKPNGSVPACVTALSNCFFKSASRAASEVASPGGFPASTMARYN